MYKFWFNVFIGQVLYEEITLKYGKNIKRMQELFFYAGGDIQGRIRAHQNARKFKMLKCMNAGKIKS